MNNKDVSRKKVGTFLCHVYVYILLSDKQLPKFLIYYVLVSLEVSRAFLETSSLLICPLLYPYFQDFIKVFN